MVAGGELEGELVGGVGGEEAAEVVTADRGSAGSLGRTGWELEGNQVVGIGGEEAAEVFATDRGGAEVLLDGVDV